MNVDDAVGEDAYKFGAQDVAEEGGNADIGVEFGQLLDGLRFSEGCCIDDERVLICGGGEDFFPMR